MNATTSNKKTPNLLQLYSDSDKLKILDMAINNITSTEFSIQNSNVDFEYKSKNINQHWYAIYEKFIIAYSCLLMFFIGAPLGAIIKKGGLGLPIVFAMMIFITFHIINTLGRKLAQEDSILPFLGSAMASLILTPLAIFLTHRATNDIAITINLDWIITPIKNSINYFKKEKTNNDLA